MIKIGEKQGDNIIKCCLRPKGRGLYNYRRQRYRE